MCPEGILRSKTPSRSIRRIVSACRGWDGFLNVRPVLPTHPPIPQNVLNSSWEGLGQEGRLGPLQLLLLQAVLSLLSALCRWASSEGPGPGSPL